MPCALLDHAPRCGRVACGDCTWPQFLAESFIAVRLRRAERRPFRPSLCNEKALSSSLFNHHSSSSSRRSDHALSACTTTRWTRGASAASSSRSARSSTTRSSTTHPANADDEREVDVWEVVDCVFLEISSLYPLFPGNELGRSRSPTLSSGAEAHQHHPQLPRENAREVGVVIRLDPEDSERGTGGGEG